MLFHRKKIPKSAGLDVTSAGDSVTLQSDDDNSVLVTQNMASPSFEISQLVYLERHED